MAAASVNITLQTNNLYRNGEIIVFTDGTKEQLLIRETVTVEESVDDVYHPVKQDDRLDKLAWSYYKDIVDDAAKFWWVIADANEIQNPLDLDEYIGLDILIPDLKKLLLSL